MTYVHQLLFGYFPYIALTTFLLGSLIRFDREQYTWRSGSSQFLRKRQLMWGSNLFHVGILGLFLGHFVGLLTPIAVFDALGITHGAKQGLAIIAGGFFGVACLAGMILLIHRRLWDARIRKTSSAMDIGILLLLAAQLMLGLITIPLSLGHMDGENMVLFMDWAQRIVTFRGGAAELIADVHWVFKLHIFLGLTIFLLFPFGRLVHIWSAPVGYILRPYQIVRSKL